MDYNRTFSPRRHLAGDDSRRWCLSADIKTDYRGQNCRVPLVETEEGCAGGGDCGGIFRVRCRVSEIGLSKTASMRLKR
jgi:hypothetical protein